MILNCLLDASFWSLFFNIFAKTLATIKFNGKGNPLTGAPFSISFSASVFGGGSGMKICFNNRWWCSGGSSAGNCDGASSCTVGFDNCKLPSSSGTAKGPSSEPGWFSIPGIEWCNQLECCQVILQWFCLDPFRFLLQPTFHSFFHLNSHHRHCLSHSIKFLLIISIYAYYYEKPTFIFSFFSIYWFIHCHFLQFSSQILIQSIQLPTSTILSSTV